MTAQLADRIKIPAAFWAGLRALGLSAADLIRQARLPLAVLTDQVAVTANEYFALWQAMHDLTGDAAIGIKLVTALPAGQLPPGLLAAYHARDYQDALQRVVRYKQLCAPERLRLSEEGDACLIALEWLYTGQTVPAALVDASMATLLELGRRGTGEALAARLVELARPNTDASVHEAYFGCRVRFGAQRNCLHLHRSDLGRAFAAYNAELLDLLTPALDEALAQRQRHHSFSDTVRWLVAHQLSGGRPDIPAVARELGVSERTLQRRLGGEGTSFQLLLTAVRRARARELLADPTLDIDEVAFLLGYADQNSFFRAFRLWEGETPSSWRAMHRNQGTLQ
ncbi:MAG: AraC family transcriptional regulator ligand-binding domain-containing protein [Cupriavidus necator]